MFSICILDGNNDFGKEKCWLSEHVTAISNYQNTNGSQKVLAAFKEEKLSKEQVFFTLSHTNYLKLNNVKVYLSNNSQKQADLLFSANEIQQIKFPRKGSFLCVGKENSISPENFAIENIPALEELLPYQLLLFHNREQFVKFSSHMDQLCMDENICTIMEKLKEYRSGNVKLLEESRWHKNQAEVLQTSLSLIRTEYQSDLKWYKDELEKVIQWYRKNHEELPPGISRLGKGINALRKRFRLRRN